MKEMLTKIDASELMEWEQYARIEPFGYKEDWYRAAKICYVVAESHRGKGRAYKVKDFMPEPVNFEVRGKKQSSEDMKLMFVGLTGGRKKSKSGRKNINGNK